MSEERKREDIVKCINGELYYLGDYANFLYEKLDEKDKKIEYLEKEKDRLGSLFYERNEENIKLRSIIKEAREYIKEDMKIWDIEQEYDMDKLLEILDKVGDNNVKD